MDLGWGFEAAVRLLLLLSSRRCSRRCMPFYAACVLFLIKLEGVHRVHAVCTRRLSSTPYGLISTCRSVRPNLD